MLIQKLLRFVNLRSQERTPTTIRMVKKHKLAVILADFVFRQGAFSRYLVSPYIHTHLYTYIQREGGRRGGTHESSRIKEASRRVIRGSNPLVLLAKIKIMITSVNSMKLYPL